MMEPIPTPEERQARAQQKKQAKMQRVAIIILTFLASGLLASTISLAVFYARHVQRCRPYMPSEVSNAPTVPQAPPVGRRSSDKLVVVPVVARTPPTAPSSKNTIDVAPLVVRAPTMSIYPITNSTNGSSPDIDSKQCDPGSVWGGRALDELNHGYMPLMQKTLSASPVGVAGEIRDYYHTALRSVFRCGESMEFGQLELVDACKSGYVVDGEKVECDEGGSIGNSTLAAV